MDEPFELFHQWLQQEKDAGAPNPQQAILSTATIDAIPAGRVVAIREITNQQELLFFTQQGTRKVKELNENPCAVLTFWFELFQREVIFEGSIEFLSSTENNYYWQSYARAAQIRFHAYAPTSGQAILNKQILEDQKKQIEKIYQENIALPMSPFYCGVKLKPSKILFYAYRLDELSDVFSYQKINQQWCKQWLSP